MTFIEYIDHIGIEELARMMSCTKQNIYKWRSLKGIPAPETAYILVLLSHGQLSFEKIYIPFLEQQLKGKKLTVPGTVGHSSIQLRFD